LPIQQITIIGTGLIGGSLGLALRRQGFGGRIIAHDRQPVLERALALGVADAGAGDALEACSGSDVVVLATPVGAIIDYLERLGPVLPPEALITDVGSTKEEIVARALAVFGDNAPRRFLPGHPMAGKEHGTIEQADPDLFRNTVWLFTPLPEPNICIDAGLCGEWVNLVKRIGAEPLVLDPRRHDRLCAWVSHLPQMVSTALAAAIGDEFGDDPHISQIGGRALREMTRIAASPYSMWRDIAMTNTANLEQALLRLEQRLAHIRENLRTRGLEEEFESGNRFATRYKSKGE
jgi:prephenate dehydrogenase